MDNLPVIAIRFALYADLMVLAGVTAFSLYALKPEERGTACLLYTSDAADERSSVDLGGRRNFKKQKKKKEKMERATDQKHTSRDELGKHKKRKETTTDT